jgi:hypothetical protein
MRFPAIRDLRFVAWNEERTVIAVQAPPINDRSNAAHGTWGDLQRIWRIDPALLTP